MNTELVKYDAACTALAEARTTDEVKLIRDKAEAMRAYARQAKNKRMEVDAAEIRLRAERRLGELIKLQKETVGLAQGKRTDLVPEAHHVGKPTLADAGIDKKLSSRAQKLAAVPDDKFEETLGEWRERIEFENERVTTSLLLAGGHRTIGTGENEWYTPSQYLEAARRVMGSIDLDPASTPSANERVKALRFFTKDDDGLSKDWSGNVWLNPPYSQPLIQQFVEKLVSENFNQAILLTHNFTDTKWFHLAASACSAICLTRGRIKFVNETEDKASPTCGQAFFYFGDRRNEFTAEFRNTGLIVGVV
jgi:phage N-6-adenine-methyltransferase